MSNQSPIPKYTLLVLAGITALGPLAIDTHLPAFPTIAGDFGVDVVSINFTMSAYMLGLSLGQIFAGPLSDQIGRKPIGIFGLLLFFTMNFLITNVQSLDQMLILRFFQAIGGGFIMAVTFPTVRDSFPPQKVASRLALIFLIMLIAPLIAPFIGSLILQWGWRWIFGMVAIYAIVLLIIYSLYIPETRTEKTKPNIGAIFRQYLQVIKHKPMTSIHPIRYGMANAFSSGVLLIYITNASWIYQTHYQISAERFPIFFAINVGMMAITQAFMARFLRKTSLIQTAKLLRLGSRIQLSLLFFLAISSTLFAMPLWFFVVFFGLTFGMLGILLPTGSGVFIANYRQLSGSATALMATSTFFFASILGYLSSSFGQGSLFIVICTLLASSLIANLILWRSTEEEKQLFEKLQNGELKPL